MKLQSLILASLFFCGSLCAQTEKVRLYGLLASDKRIHQIALQHFDSIKISIPVDALDRFLFKGDLPKGFYEMDSIGTVYLCPGYRMMIKRGRDRPSGEERRQGREPVEQGQGRGRGREGFEQASNQGGEGGYRFIGAGALENNALRASRASSYIPVDAAGDMQPAVYSLAPAEFLKKIDSLQTYGEQLFKQSADSFFIKTASLDLKFYGRALCQTYYLHIIEEQLDTAKKIDSSKMIRNMIKMTAKVGGLVSRVYSPFDRNDETLFRNSSSYRQAFDVFFEMKGFYGGAEGMFKNGVFQKLNAGDLLLHTDLAKLRAAGKEIDNPYIRSYYDYSFTQSVLKDAKDTAISGKYYREYIGHSPRADRQAAIQEIYDNAVTYRDSAMAPAFSYRDTRGVPVTLHSLLGKYIYIDVWATWCGPCKEELPHLKEIETAYKDKNIQFVSISVDQPEDEKKWSAFVSQNDLQGLQLLADSAFESVFIRKMGIHSIPRFILIDPSGRMISADALRPSDAALRETLDKFL